MENPQQPIQLSPEDEAAIRRDIEIANEQLANGQFVTYNSVAELEEDFRRRSTSD